MFGSSVLDIAIGLVFMYLLLSLICTAVQEGLEGWLKVRAVDLERGIRELLQDQDGTGLTTELYDHPLINGLFRGDYAPAKQLSGKPGGPSRRLRLGTDLPSYIPSANFALALLDIAARGPISTNTKNQQNKQGQALPGGQAAASPQPASQQSVADSNAPILDLNQVRKSIASINNRPVQRALLTAIDTATGDLAKAQVSVEAWYNSAMDRVSGWYKRRTQLVLFALGLIVAIAANANSFTVAEGLSRDKSLRDAVVAEAQATASRPTAPAANAHEQVADLDKLRLPIGWSDVEFLAPWDEKFAAGKYCVPQRPCSASYYWLTYVILPILGWLMTAIALSLGAPFWFDVLNKIMRVRSTVKPKEKGPKKA